MNTIRDFAYLLRSWWQMRSGPIAQRLIYQANAELTDPEWWTTQPMSLRVHPLRCHAYDSKAAAAAEIVGADVELSQRRARIVATWGLPRHAQSSVVS